MALSLSDSFCVERHRADFLELITSEVDVVFANEAEACALFVATDLAHALAAFDEMGVLADLARLGLDWDGVPSRQSEQIERHRAAFEQLRDEGRVYRCWSTRSPRGATPWRRRVSVPSAPPR